LRNYLKAHASDPLHDAVIGPDEHVGKLVVAHFAPLLELPAVVVEALEARDAKLQARSMEAVDHLQLAALVLLVEVVKHARVHQALHERGAVLRQAERGQPRVADPLVVHVAERQCCSRRFRRRGAGQRHHLLDRQSQLQSVQRITEGKKSH